MTVQNNQGHQAEIDGFGIDEARSLKRLLTRFMKPESVKLKRKPFRISHFFCSKIPLEIA